MDHTARLHRLTAGQGSWSGRPGVDGAPPAPQPSTIGLVVVVSFGLMLVDVVAGRAALGEYRVVVVADASVIAATVLAVRQPVVATFVAAAVSIAVSATAAHLVDGYTPVMGTNGAMPGLAEVGAIGFLVAYCTRVLPRRQAALAWLALAGTLAALVTWRNQGNYTTVLAFVAAVGFWVVLGVGEYLRSIDRDQRVRAQEARSDERAAIARELHDVVAHHVTGIVLQAQAARLVAAGNRSGDGDDAPGVVASALEAIEQAGADALRSMRAMVGTLRTGPTTAPLAPTATVDDLRALGAAPTHHGETPVELHMDGDPNRLPATVVASVHRVVLEAVTNARRHGRGATAIDVRIRCQPRTVQIAVVNDGLPPPPRNSQGFGLIGIAERVEALGGRVTSGPRSGGGWRVDATIPTDGAGA